MHDPDDYYDPTEGKEHTDYGFWMSPPDFPDYDEHGDPQ